MRFNTENLQDNTNSNPADNGVQSTPQAHDLTPLTQSLNEFNAKKDAFNTLKQSLISDFRISLESLAKEIFVTIPELKAISWLQYTPYFNDGDSCTFSIHEILFYNFIPEDGFFEYEDPRNEEDKTEGSWCVTDYSLKKTGLSSEVIAFLKQFSSIVHGNSEFVQEIFNDHSKIIWTADGIEIEDYSNHD